MDDQNAIPSQQIRLPPIYKHGLSNDKNFEHNDTNRKNLVFELNENLVQNEMDNPEKLEILSQNSPNRNKSANQCVSTYNGTLDVKEMPLNPFDFIWYSNTLNREFSDDKDNYLTGDINTQSFNSNNWSFGSNNQMIFDDFKNKNQVVAKVKPSKKFKKNKPKNMKKSKKIKNSNADDNGF